MRIKLALIGLTMATILSLSTAQQTPLDIGVRAPAIHSNAWIKGTPIDRFQKGQVYVLVFWNGDASPYAPPLPHLTPEMKGDIEFVSVNTYDRWLEPRTSSEASHRERIEAILRNRPETYPTHVCLDDASTTIAGQWLLPRLPTTMPYAAIVGREGQLAWMGPARALEKPLIQVCRCSFDEAGFKRRFDEELSAYSTRAQLARDIEQAGKNWDSVLVDGLMLKLNGYWGGKLWTAVYHSSIGNPDFGLAYLKSKINNDTSLASSQWSYLLARIALQSERLETKREALRISALCLGDCSYSELPLGWVYYAQTLGSLGRKEEAIRYIDRAKAQVETYREKKYRDVLERFIESARAEIQAL